MDDLRFVPLTDATMESYADLVQWTWGSCFTGAELAADPGGFHTSPERAIALADGERIVAQASSLELDLRVPGGLVKAAGLTEVGVHTEYRRRGLLTRMIDRHLAECRERGESLSILYASEYPIYSRFGFGLASQTYSVTMPSGIRLDDAPGTEGLTAHFDVGSFEKHAEMVERIQTACLRPGIGVRRERCAQKNYLRIAPLARRTREPKRIVWIEDGSGPVAYALYYRGPGGEDIREARVVEHVSTSTASAAALWRALTNLDLVGSTAIDWLPTDDSLLFLAQDARVLKPKLHDNLWLRLIDLPKALQNRRYLQDANLILDVLDSRIEENSGTWRLAIEGGEAHVERCAETPDLAIDIRHLASAYLGRPVLVDLERCGFIAQHTSGAALALQRAMTWDQMPACTWDF